MAQAEKIMVIRHAEKPPKNPPPNGVDPDGQADPESLTPRGWQRAGALVRLFDPSNGGPREGLAVPAVLIASNPRSDGSKRPLETLTPLAQHLHLDVNDPFRPADYIDAARFAVKSDGVSLICWQHEDIPAMGEAIGGVGSVPAEWPGDRFDIVWVFDYDQRTGAYLFSQVPQNLLPGDQNNTL